MLGYDKYKMVEIPPETALRTITGGRQAGKTDINPQWRFEAMTNTYGLCGIGWKYEIVKQWTESGSNNEVMAFTNVLLYLKNGDYWSAPIPGTGGNTLIEKEKSGMHNNDDAFKMSLTDALSVAMKVIGVGAEVYRGNFEGCKYLGKQRNIGNGNNTSKNHSGNSGGKQTTPSISDADVIREIEEANLDDSVKASLKKDYTSKSAEVKPVYYRDVIKKRLDKAGKKNPLAGTPFEEEYPQDNGNNFDDTGVPFGTEEAEDAQTEQFQEDPIPGEDPDKVQVGSKDTLGLY